MINFAERKKKNIVLLPEEIIQSHYTGEIFGRYISNTGVFNVRKTSSDIIKAEENLQLIGVIYQDEDKMKTYNKYKQYENFLLGKWIDNEIKFSCNDETYTVQIYNFIQNIFSRNTGILESNVMMEKCAFILGCGSVGSLVALELARSGVGNFVLIDNDILEYHNLCRHQCSISDVGEYKVEAVKKRILNINPYALVSVNVSTVENVNKKIFDDYCKKDTAIIVGCADNRTADVYANGIAVTYNVPFISIGLWERAFAGEIFYWLPKANMPCYKCALGDGGDISQRKSTNRRIYTNEEDLNKVNFEPGISADINFVTIIAIKLIIDILNLNNNKYTQRLLSDLRQYTLICNTNKVKIAGEMAEIFSYPLQVTTSLKVNYLKSCPPCEFE